MDRLPKINTFIHHLVIYYVLSIIIRDFLAFEIRKNLDLRKILVTPKIFLKSRFHCTTNFYLNYRCLRLPQNCGYPLGLSQEKSIQITTLLIARNCLRRITFQFMGPLVSYRSIFIRTMFFSSFVLKCDLIF